MGRSMDAPGSYCAYGLSVHFVQRLYIQDACVSWQNYEFPAKRLGLDKQSDELLKSLCALGVFV